MDTKLLFEKATGASSLSAFTSSTVTSNFSIKNLKTTNHIPINTIPIANIIKYSFQCELISGIQLKDAISIKPPENTPTIPNKYI